jgi:hypothetical protein
MRSSKTDASECFANVGLADDSFPLTPALSPGERETGGSPRVSERFMSYISLRAYSRTKNRWLFKNWPNVLPLLGERVGVRGTATFANLTG